jgi:sporulation protein YlmC with PRC-barrel domain
MTKKRKPFKQDLTNENKSCIKMEKTDKPVTRFAIEAIQVIDAKGRLVGKVKDVALAVGKTGISLLVENKAGETQNISWDDVKAASDYILLREIPESVPIKEEKNLDQKDQPKQETIQATVQEKSNQPLCPTCSEPLKWIPKYKRWYCYNDKKYVNPV